jgi:hypothetical protein
MGIKCMGIICGISTLLVYSCCILYLYLNISNMFKMVIIGMGYDMHIGILK